MAIALLVADADWMMAGVAHMLLPVTVVMVVVTRIEAIVRLHLNVTELVRQSGTLVLGMSLPVLLGSFSLGPALSLNPSTHLWRRLELTVWVVATVLMPESCIRTLWAATLTLLRSNVLSILRLLIPIAGLTSQASLGAASLVLRRDVKASSPRIELGLQVVAIVWLFTLVAPLSLGLPELKSGQPVRSSSLLALMLTMMVIF